MPHACASHFEHTFKLFMIFSDLLVTIVQQSWSFLPIFTQTFINHYPLQVHPHKKETTAKRGMYYVHVLGSLDNATDDV